MRRPRNTLFLNIKRKHTKKTRWNASCGVRELIQNLWDGILQRRGIDPWDVEVVKDQSPKSGVVTFNFYGAHNQPRGFTAPPAARRKSTIQPQRNDQSQLCAKISYSPNLKELKLVNYGVSLDRNILSLGTTSKKEASHAIGGHGEGLKVGTW